MLVAPVERPVASASYGFVRFIGGGLAPYFAARLAASFNVHVPFYLGAGTVVVAIAVLANAEIFDVGRHAFDGLSHAFDVVLAGIRGRQRRDFTLDQLARVQQFERTGSDVAIPRARRGSRGGHEDAGADAHFDQPADFERNDRLADRRTADA